jgi:hypothetical protein
VSLSCFMSWQTAQASAPMKPGKRFGFHLQCQLHPRAGASLQFPEGTAPRVRPDLLAARNALRRLRRLRSSRAGAIGSVGTDLNRPVKAFDTILARS